MERRGTRFILHGRAATQPIPPRRMVREVARASVPSDSYWNDGAAHRALLTASYFSLDLRCTNVCRPAVRTTSCHLLVVCLACYRLVLASLPSIVLPHRLLLCSRNNNIHDHDQRADYGFPDRFWLPLLMAQSLRLRHESRGRSALPFLSHAATSMVQERPLVMII